MEKYIEKAKRLEKRAYSHLGFKRYATLQMLESAWKALSKGDIDRFTTLVGAAQKVVDVNYN